MEEQILHQFWGLPQNYLVFLEYFAQTCALRHELVGPSQYLYERKPRKVRSWGSETFMFLLFAQRVDLRTLFVLRENMKGTRVKHWHHWPKGVEPVWCIWGLRTNYVR